MNAFNFQQMRAARLLQKDIPLVSRPFAQIAELSGMTQDELISWLKALSEKAVLRKFGAILRHQRAGYGQNALVTWALPPDGIEKTGAAFAKLAQVSHCYERSPSFLNRYNLFTMVHARDSEMASVLDHMSQIANSQDFLILESLEEYKKTSPEYF